MNASTSIKLDKFLEYCRENGIRLSAVGQIFLNVDGDIIFTPYGKITEETVVDDFQNEKFIGNYTI